MKKLSFFICLVCFAFLLNSCYYPPQSQPLTMEVKVDKPVYRIGEKIIITVRASRTCYLSLYDISTEGEVTQIFPNRFAADNVIQGGQIYRIPGETDNFDFEVAGPPGIERVRAVGTVNNVNFFNQKQSNTMEVFPRIYQAPGQFDQSLNRKLEAIPSEQWAEASVTFQVR